MNQFICCHLCQSLRFPRYQDHLLGVSDPDPEMTRIGSHRASGPDHVILMNQEKDPDPVTEIQNQDRLSEKDPDQETAINLSLIHISEPTRPY